MSRRSPTASPLSEPKNRTVFDLSRPVNETQTSSSLKLFRTKRSPAVSKPNSLKHRGKKGSSPSSTSRSRLRSVDNHRGSSSGRSRSRKSALTSNSENWGSTKPKRGIHGLSSISGALMKSLVTPRSSRGDSSSHSPKRKGSSSRKGSPSNYRAHRSESVPSPPGASPVAKKSSIAKKASKWARTLSPPPSRRNSRSSSIERSSSEKTRKRKKSRSKSRDEPLADTRLSSRTERQQHRHSFSSTNDEPTRSRTCRSSLPTLSSKRTFETDAWKDEYADEYSMARGRVSSRDVPRPPGQQHVIVFVHGFQGTKYDMHLFRNQLQSLYPDTACLLSSSNQQKNSEVRIRGRSVHKLCHA